MNIKRFNENNNLKLYFKKYKCDSTDIEFLHTDIKDLIDSGNLLYDLYYYDSGNSWNFLIYAYINDPSDTFHILHKFYHSTEYKDLGSSRNAIRSSNFRRIKKEDIDEIFYSNISI